MNSLKKILSSAFALSMVVTSGMAKLQVRAEEYQNGVVVSANTDFPEAETDYQATFTLLGDYDSVTMSNSFNYWTQDDWNNYNAGNTDGMKMKSLYEYKKGMFETGYPVVGEAYEYALTEVETDVWQITVPVHAGMYYYGYNCTKDGNVTKVLDPANLPEAHPFNNHDCGWSLLYVDGEDVIKGQEYVLPTDAAKGTLSWETYTAADGTEQPLGVYLPAGFDPVNNAYPVAYVSHGGGGNEADWMTIGDIPTILDNLIAEGEVAPMIAVTMDNTYWGWNYDNIKKNLMENIIPYIETKYGVSTDPADRAFCGLSMGGLTTTSVYSTLADQFGYFGPWSATNGGSLNLDEVPGAKLPVIMFGYGCMDFGKGGYPAFGTNLESKGIEYSDYEVGGAHDWGVWRELFTIFAKDYLWETPKAGVTVTENVDFPEAETDYQATFVLKGDYDSVTMSNSFNYYTQEDWANYDAGDTYDINTKSLYEYKKGMFETGYPAVGAAPTYALTKIANGTWAITVPVHAGMYYYGYNCTKDGVETKVLDPTNLPEAHPFNNHDCGWSLLYVYGDDVIKGQEYVLPTDAPKGTLSWETYTATDGTEQPLGVYLPAGFDPVNNVYPVVYVSHGGGGNEADWMTIGDIPTILDNLIAEGSAVPMIAVTMDNTYWGWNYDNIKKNLMENIIPYIETKYGVSKEPADRGFCGLSMGGLTTTSVYSTLADQFGYFGPWSATNGGSLNLEEVPGADTPEAIMFGYGCMDFGKGGYPAFGNNLAKAGIPYTDYEVGGAHDWGVWRELFTIFAKNFLFKEVEQTPAGVVVSKNTDFPEAETDYQATFTYRGDADQVTLSSSMNYYTQDDWKNYNEGNTDGINMKSIYEFKKGMFETGYPAVGEAYVYELTEVAPSVWQLTVPVHAGMYYYGFNVIKNGFETKVLDKANLPEAHPFNGHDCGWSLLYVDGEDVIKGQEYDLPTDAPKGELKWDTYTAVDGTTQPLGVYLPAGYTPAKTYPVAYVSHGGGGNEADWMTIGDIPTILDNLIAKGEVESMIAVTMDNTYFGWNMDNIKKNLMENIIPYIEFNYSVGKKPSDRAFCGLSMGGLTTTSVYSTLADQFGYLGPWSATNGGSLDLSTIKDAGVPSIMLGYGCMDFGKGGYPAFRDNLDAAGIAYSDYEVGGAHDWGVWRELFTIFAKDYLWENNAPSPAGVEVEKNTNEEWAAPYVATFTYVNDSDKEIESISIRGGWQFYKESEVGSYVGAADNSSIPCYDAYHYEDGMFAGSSSTMTNGMIDYPLTKVANDTWQVQIPCPANQYFYAYWITYADGSVAEKVYDPANLPKAAPSGSDAGWSLLLVGDASTADKGQEFIYPGETPHGKVEYRPYTAEDGSEQWIGIYTPAGYDKTKKYPTIYVSHGGGGNEDEWYTIGSVNEIMDNLISLGLADEAIVVTMNNTYFGWDYDRIYKNTVECIIPFVEYNYSVYTEASGRAFCGLSMGSMTTNNFAVYNPEVFDYFGSFSGGISGLDAAKEAVNVEALNSKTLYLTAGNIDMAWNNTMGISSVDFMKMYDELGVDYTFDLLLGSHDWYVWRESFTNFVRDYLWDNGPMDLYTGFKWEDGALYWYELGEKQGVEGDKQNITDAIYGVERGREIYDPKSDAWYWLDANAGGAVARDKEVWMPYIFQGEDPATEGKWVRYDKYGQMIKGWYANDNGVYYYDLLTGAMYKGTYEIDGKTYTFDALTGIRQ